MSYFSLKRLFDFLSAFFLLIILFPIIFLSLVLVSIVLRESPVFVQKRIGKGAQDFSMFKVKSMKTGSLKVTNHWIIRLLRSSGMDELPQLWNVLVGEMSLVGPRPLPVAYKGLIKPDHHRRHSVTPGITGLAQVSGGNEKSWRDRFELDIEYVNNCSFWTDLKILLRTPITILGKRNTDSGVLTADY